MNKRSAVRDRLSNLVRSYPRQFWLLFTGMLISTLGASMVWPFLMIYVSGRLKLPLTEVASLMTINAASCLSSLLMRIPMPPADWILRIFPISS